MGGGTLRTLVDQAVDGLGVIGEAWGQSSVGQSIGVSGDEVAIVGGDLLGLFPGQAVPAAMALFGLNSWMSESADGEEGGDRDGGEGRHSCCLRALGEYA